MDKLALGPQNSAQLQSLGHIQAGEQAVAVQEMAMPGMLMVTTQATPTAGGAARSVEALEQDVRLTAMALEDSPFAAPAPVNSANGILQIAPRIERGRGQRPGYSYNVMNAYTLLNIQHGQMPRLTKGMQRRLDGMRPRSRVQHLRMERELKDLMRQLVEARAPKAPAPAGAVTNRFVIGEQAWHLQGMTGAMPLGLRMSEEGIRVWNETNYGYRPGPVGPNHYDALERAAMNAELNRLQGKGPSYQLGTVPEMVPEPKMAEKKPEDLLQEEPKPAPSRLQQSMALRFGRGGLAFAV